MTVDGLEDEKSQSQGLKDYALKKSFALLAICHHVSMLNLQLSLFSGFFGTLC